MAYSLLNVLNDVLKAGNIVTSDLTAVTGNGPQQAVDVAIQSINEVLRNLLSGVAAPGEITQGTITLVTDTREYTLASDFVSFAEAGPEGAVLVDQTNGWIVYPYPGGFARMFHDQKIPANYTGLPHYYAINPTNRKLRFNTVPTSQEN